MEESGRRCWLALCQCEPFPLRILPSSTWFESNARDRWHSNLGQGMAGFEEICAIRDHSNGSRNKENKSCAVGLDLQLDVAPQL